MAVSNQNQGSKKYMLPFDGRNCKVTWERTQILEGCHLSGFALTKLIFFLFISIAIYPPISICPRNHNILSMYDLKCGQEVKSSSPMIANPFSSLLIKAPLFLSGAEKEEQRQPFIRIRAPPSLEPVDWRRFFHIPQSAQLTLSGALHRGALYPWGVLLFLTILIIPPNSLTYRKTISSNEYNK